MTWHQEIKEIPPSPELIEIIKKILEQNEVILRALCTPKYIVHDKERG